MIIILINSLTYSTNSGNGNLHPNTIVYQNFVISSVGQLLLQLYTGQSVTFSQLYNSQCKGI